MTLKKLFYAAMILLFSGSILLADACIGKPADTYTFCFADFLSIIEFIFLECGLVFMLISLFRKEQ